MTGNFDSNMKTSNLEAQTVSEWLDEKQAEFDAIQYGEWQRLEYFQFYVNKYFKGIPE